VISRFQRGALPGSATLPSNSEPGGAGLDCPALRIWHHPSLSADGALADACHRTEWQSPRLSCGSRYWESTSRDDGSTQGCTLPRRASASRLHRRSPAIHRPVARRSTAPQTRPFHGFAAVNRGRNGRLRTCDPSIPNRVRYLTALRSGTVAGEGLEPSSRRRMKPRGHTQQTSRHQQVVLNSAKKWQGRTGSNRRSRGSDPRALTS
jgi:hypothetical protein